LDIKARQILYSYDYDAVFARDQVEIIFNGIQIKSNYLKIDCKSQTAQIYGNIELKKPDETMQSLDEIIINLKDFSSQYSTFRDGIVATNGQGEKILIENLKDVSLFEKITISNMKKSLLYFQAGQILIFKQFKISAKDVYVFLEGNPGILLEEFDIRGSSNAADTGFEISQFRLSNSQGIGIGVKHKFKLGENFLSSNNIYYEERGWIEGQNTYERALRINTTNTYKYSASGNANFLVDYDTIGSWDIKGDFSHKFEDGHLIKSQVYFFHPSYADEELWFNLGGGLELGSFGSADLNFAYEQSGRINTDMDYSNSITDNLMISSQISYNKQSANDSLLESQMIDGAVQVSYDTSFISANAGFMFNKDLLTNTVFEQPMFSINIKPIKLYYDLLTFSASNRTIYSSLRQPDLSEQINFSNYSFLSMKSDAFELFPNSNVSIDLRLEQLFFRNSGPITQMGIVVDYTQKLVGDNAIHLTYNYNTRRNSGNWFIEGTNTSMLIGQLDYNVFGFTKGNLSFSMDVESLELYSSSLYLDLSLGERWSLNTLISYDFLMDRINDVNIMLKRDIIRGDIKLRWRQSTNSFILEFSPK